MTILLSVPHTTCAIPSRARLKKLATYVVEYVRPHHILPTATISVVCTNNHDMAVLNATWKGRQGPTDVLSFPLYEGQGPVSSLIGEIFINGDVVADRALFAGISPVRYFEQLFVHGMLSLCGHDHHRSEERRVGKECRSRWS